MPYVVSTPWAEQKKKKKRKNHAETQGNVKRTSFVMMNTDWGLATVKHELALKFMRHKNLTRKYDA